MGTNVSSADFTEILADMGRTVSWYVATKTTDFEGNETDTYAAPANLTAVFFLNDQRWQFDKEGFTEVGDAYLIVPNDSTVKKYDKVAIDSQTYVIQTVKKRYVLTVAMQVFCTLYKTE